MEIDNTKIYYDNYNFIPMFLFPESFKSFYFSTILLRTETGPPEDGPLKWDINFSLQQTPRKFMFYSDVPEITIKDMKSSV